MKRILLLFLLMASYTCFANRIYVNLLATGANDGTSWANAYTKLQTALTKAQANDTVMVAEGVYKKLDAYSAYAFYLNAGTLLGGYPNTGNPTDAQRDWANHPTVIDGSPTANSADVLLIENLSNAVVVDGVIITNGSRCGVKIKNTAPVIFKNTLFKNNIYETINNINSQVTFTNCVFFSNTNVSSSSANANTSFYNCVIVNNSGGYEGVIKSENATLAVYNCTFSGNTGIPVVGSGSGSTIITNCIMWGNKYSEWPNKVYSDFRSVNHSLQISHCITQIYYDDNDNTLLMNNHPRFLNQQQPAGTDDKFFTADDGLQLTAPCSPALNFGNNTPLASVATDLLGNPRIFNGGTIDLGAYEMQLMPGVPLKTVYVNSSATGNQNGGSWTNAFTTLQQALLYCADTIKMAAGTYLTPNSYADSVFVLESGKVILGGYPATGNPADADRNPQVHHTILKGNYTKTPTGIFNPVIKAIHTKENTVLDGIKVTNFAAIGSTQAYAITVDVESKLKILNCDFRIDTTTIVSPGLLIRGSSTVYIYNTAFNDGPWGSDNPPAVYCSDNSNTFFDKCAFQGNAYVNGLSITNAKVTLDSCTGWSNGDAVFINANTAALTINNCLFRAYNNHSIFISSSKTTGTVNNSIFRNLASDYTIPAIYNDNSQLTFNKCLFDSSRLVMQNANYSAPVLNNCLSVHGRLMKNRRSFPVVNNCTVVNTYVPPRHLDNLPRQELVINEDSTVFRANNTIFWSERQVDNKKDITDQDNPINPAAASRSILTNCLTQLYGTHGQNGNIVGKVPRFNRLDVILGPDGKLFTSDDGLQLAACSPAVNAGNPSLSPTFPTDVLDNPRIAQSTIDMGAYEFQAAAGNAGTYYVNKAATGLNNGSSWTDAYTDLQTALCNSCADTIRVAAGTYKPSTTTRDSTFEINRPMALYGGYAATGNPSANDRNAIKYPTILSGEFGDPTDSTDNFGLVVFVNSVIDSVHIDGFVIRDGTGYGGGFYANAEGGAGMSVVYTNAGIYNCQFIHNTALFGGGLSLGTYSNCTVSDCIFSGNTANNRGGALYSKNKLRLTNCVFENNQVAIKGGAMAVEGVLNMSNSVFYRNFTTFSTQFGLGGAVYLVNVGGYIYNCTFVENKATAPYYYNPGGGVYIDQARNIQLKNCVFNGNNTGGATTNPGADYNHESAYNQFTNSVLQFSRPYLGDLGNKFTADARFKAVNDPKGPDGIWLTKDDGLQLNYASLAVNRGLNAAIPTLTTDILGYDRIVLDTVDAGAYEYQDRPEANAGADTVICAGTSVTIGRDGNPAHTYSWTSEPAGFTSTAVMPVVNPSVATTYFLEVSNGADISKDTVKVDMSSSLSPAVSITTAKTNVCANASVAFTATPLYGGTNPGYQWQVNGANAGTNTAVFNTTVNDGDKISVVLTSNLSCASPATAASNIITMQVTPVVVPEVTLNGPVTLCYGDTGTYTATPVNGGTKPKYTWYKRGFWEGENFNNTYNISYVSEISEIYVVMTSNAVCQTKPTDTSNVITVVPKTKYYPSVSVTASSNGYCGARLVTFTAQGMGTGSSPQWQWKLNGNNTGANSNVFQSNSLTNGDNVYVVMTNNEECAIPPVAESNRIIMSITKEIFPTVTITGPATVTQDSMYTFTANVLNANGAVRYQWYDSTSTHRWQQINGATSQSINYAPHQTGDGLRCVISTTTNCGYNAVALYDLTFNVNTVTGVQPVPADEYGITYGPNPVYTQMVIDGLRLSDQWQTLEITSFEGRQKIATMNITGQTKLTLYTGQLKAGLYIAILRKKNGEMVYIKFVKL